MNFRKFIKWLPFPVLRSLGSLYQVIPSRIRFGKVFWETYHFLQQSQWWSREKLEKYQISQLEKLLRHAENYTTRNSFKSAANYSIQLEEANKIIEKFKKTYPHLADWLRRQKNE